MMCKVFLSSSAWRTCAPGLQKGMRVIHSLTQRQGRPASLMQMPLLNNNKKKVDGNNKPLVGAPTIAAAAVAGGGRDPRGDKQPWQPSSSDEGGPQCPVHNSRRHSTEKCREIKKSHGAIPRAAEASTTPWEGKQQAAPEGNKKEEMEFQDAKRVLKAIYGHSDSDSSTNERRKQLHIMYDGS
jgi:hypothetical protein